MQVWLPKMISSTPDSVGVTVRLDKWEVSTTSSPNVEILLASCPAPPVLLPLLVPLGMVPLLPPLGAPPLGALPLAAAPVDSAATTEDETDVNRVELVDTYTDDVEMIEVATAEVSEEEAGSEYEDGLELTGAEDGCWLCDDAW